MFLAGLEKGIVSPGALESMAGLKTGETRDIILAGAWPLAALPEDMLRALRRVAGAASLSTHELRAFQRDGTSVSVDLLGAHQRFGELYWIFSGTNAVAVKALDVRGRVISTIHL